MIRPCFDKNSINLCFIFDDNYSFYFSVLLTSVIKNSNPDSNYDIVILHDEKLHINSIKKLQLMITKSNFSLRFVDISHLAQKLKQERILFTRLYYTDAVYYPSFIPIVFKYYEKILYIDVDTIVLKDLKDLFDTELEDMFLGVVADLPIILGITLNSNTHFSNYVKNTLKMKTKQYFNSGVLLFNIKQCNSINFLECFLDTLKDIKEPIFMDQCVFNAMLENRVKFLDLRYNNEVCFYKTHRQHYKTMPQMTMLADFEESKKDVCILHYAAVIKPWYYPDSEKADIWWEYAKHSPFYELIVFKKDIYLQEKLISKLENEKINLQNNVIDKQKKLDSMLQNLNSTKNLLDFLKNFGTAKERVHTHLAYKLGLALIENSKSIKGYIRMPYVLSYIKDKHKAEQKAYNEKILKNPSLKLPSLDSYPDYEAALKEKECITYKLGEALIENMKRGGALKYLRFYKDVRRIKREFKRK